MSSADIGDLRTREGGNRWHDYRSAAMRKQDTRNRTARGGHATTSSLPTQRWVQGEHQLDEYVAKLELGECARILAASPIPLSTLAARDPASRVGAGEDRDFEEVIWAWTLRVLSGVEGG